MTTTISTLDEVFSFLLPRPKIVSTLRLVSQNWEIVAAGTKELQVASVSDKDEGYVCINATSTLGCQEPVNLTLKNLSKPRQLAQAQRYVASNVGRLKAHGVTLDLTINVTSKDLFEQAMQAFAPSENLQVGLEPTFDAADSIRACESSPPALGITKLDFNKSNQLQDKDIAIIGNVFPRVRSLNLSNNSSLTALAMKTVLSKLPKLQHIFLHRCTGIKDIGLDYVGGLLEIETIELDGCDQFTDMGIKYLVYGEAKANEMAAAEAAAAE